jgi:hypothetical protein
MQDYVARHRLISEALLQFGRNVPAAQDDTASNAVPRARWDGGLKVLLNHHHIEQQQKLTLVHF